MREDVKRAASELAAFYTFPHLAHFRTSIRLAARKGANLDVVNRKLSQVAVSGHEEVVVGKLPVVGWVPQACFVGEELIGLLIHQHVGEGFLRFHVHCSKAIAAPAGVSFEVDGAVYFARLDTSG
jgi:hypothetical protein